MSQGWAGYTHKDGSMWKVHFVCVPSQNTQSGLGVCPAGNVCFEIASEVIGQSGTEIQ